MSSLRNRLMERAVGAFDTTGYVDDWMAAGNDVVALGRVAKTRRRIDVKSPPLPIRQRWATRSIDVGGFPLHLVTRRSGSTGRVVLWLHGGAYVLGPAGADWSIGAGFAKALDADLAVWDYPKVPEHDATTTLPTTIAAWERLATGYGPANIVVIGASAGGGLAASLMLSLRDHNRPQPAGAVLSSPWLDVGVTHPEAAALEADDIMLSIEGLRRDGELYGGRLGVDDPGVSPWFAERLDGLAPHLVQIGTREVLAPEGRDWVARVGDAGGDATLVVDESGAHCRMLFPVPEGRALRDRAIAYLQPLLGR